jgi:disulfide bond formation protein DsbB
MRCSVRGVFAFLALASAGLVAVGWGLGEWLRLNPCPLCIFQRLLYLVFACLALGGVLRPVWSRLWSALLALTAAGGLATAVYQSWLQFAAEPALECGFGPPNLIEQLVDWLGMQWPTMFMATGFCSSKEWVFLGLSMAVWSGLCFLVLLLAALGVFLKRA